MVLFKTTQETAISSDKQLFLRNLLLGKNPVYVMGRNKYAEYVNSALYEYSRDVTAYIDDFTEGVEFLGKPVISSKDTPSGEIVVSCVVDGKPLTALNRLRTCGIVNVIDYFALSALEPQLFPPPDFCKNNRKDISENRNKYLWLRDIFEDPISLKTLEDIVAFRYSFNLNYMTSFSFRINEQYFESFVSLSENEVFVDGGGFDGETTKEFIKKVPKYGKIYFFEPFMEMLNIAERKLSSYPNVNFFQKALYDKKEVLSFDTTKGSASSISSEGNHIVEAVRLGDIIHGKIGFVKLDIEGAELKALKGAEKTIVKYRPKIAVCVYHNQEHFWKIPEYLLKLNKAYKVYLRHYTEGILETVTYFV